MTLFSRARRVLRRLLDRAAGKAHDGPDLPPRFADEARLFLLLNPAATALEWEAFALSLARAAHRDAYGRGLDARDDAPAPLALLHPDDAAARERSMCEVGALREVLDGSHESDPLLGVPLEDRARAAARLGEMLGAWRGVP